MKKAKPGIKEKKDNSLKDILKRVRRLRHIVARFEERNDQFEKDLISFKSGFREKDDKIDRLEEENKQGVLEELKTMADDLTEISELRIAIKSKDSDEIELSAYSLEEIYLQTKIDLSFEACALVFKNYCHQLLNIQEQIKSLVMKINNSAARLVEMMR